MIFAHLRLRRRLALLAAGVLDPEERDETRAHVEACARCRREYAELQAVVSSLADDPVRGAEPELPVAVMIDRVERAIERGEAKTAGPTVGWRLALPGAVAAALALFLLGPHLASRFERDDGYLRRAGAKGAPRDVNRVSGLFILIRDVAQLRPHLFQVGC